MTLATQWGITTYKICLFHTERNLQSSGKDKPTIKYLIPRLTFKLLISRATLEVHGPYISLQSAALTFPRASFDVLRLWYNQNALAMLEKDTLRWTGGCKVTNQLESQKDNRPV